ncbi:unnamed protein product [Caenorhabditis sp. 36 PRJEB53466]|nr:unnamed protein product [Caenorhabditis sp. 36 PRJEB53466]
MRPLLIFLVFVLGTVLCTNSTKSAKEVAETQMARIVAAAKKLDLRTFSALVRDPRKLGWGTWVAMFINMAYEIKSATYTSYGIEAHMYLPSPLTENQETYKLYPSENSPTEWILQLYEEKANNKRFVIRGKRSCIYRCVEFEQTDDGEGRFQIWQDDSSLALQKDRCKWNFYAGMDEEKMWRKGDGLINDTPSRRDGLSYEMELDIRQRGGMIIHEIVMHLTYGKGELGVSGVAATLFNRFFKLHSFERCDYRDVAATCVFLAGKNEDSPKKLKYIVNQLWQVKFPHHTHFPSEQHFNDLCEVVTFLEEIVLKTISFDINIDLPNECVLKVMSLIDKDSKTYTPVLNTAYYMVTDLLNVTDWSIRYSCASIATACVNIAAFFHNVNIDSICPPEYKNTWYRFQDDRLTRSELESMTREFIDLYSRNPHLHIGTLKNIDPNGKVKIVTQQQNHVSSFSSSTNTKKLDMETYKERQKRATVTSTESPRQSFLAAIKNQRLQIQKTMETTHDADGKKLNSQRRHRSSPSPSHSRRNYRHHHNHHSHHQQHQKKEASRKAVKPRKERNTVRNEAKKPRLDYQVRFATVESFMTTERKKGRYHDHRQQQLDVYQQRGMDLEEKK